MPQAFIEIKCTQFDSKQELRRLLRRISELLIYNVTVGIHKNEGQRKASSNGKYNLATLSLILEEGVSWVQSKTKKFFEHEKKTTTYGGKTYKYKNSKLIGVIKKGTFVGIPPRTFINLPKLPSVWNKIVKTIDALVITFLTKDSYLTVGTKFWGKVGSEIELNQKERVKGNYGPANSMFTTILKGSSTPLFDTGKLLKSIKFKVNKDFEGSKKTAKLPKIEELYKMTGLKK